MPGTTHPWRSSSGDGECRCGSVLGGGALGRARRVFYEDQRRSNEPHLGPDAPSMRRRSSGNWRQARGTSARKRRRWLARLWKRSRSVARGRFSGAAAFRSSVLAESGTREDRGTRVCSWVGDTAGLISFASFWALNTHRSARSGSPGRASRCEEETKRRLGPNRSQRPFTRRGVGGLGSRVRPEDRRKTICGPTPADAIALRRGAREATRGQRYAQPVRPEKTTLRGSG